MINKDLLKKFREDFQETVKPLEEKYNMKISLTSINYSDNKFTGKLEVESKDENAGRAEFERYATMFGFKKEDYNAIVSMSGKQYSFIGFNITKPKWRIKLKNVLTGETVATTQEQMKLLLHVSASGSKN